MSQKDFEVAITRLKQAKQDIYWAHSVLKDPASNLRDYDLTQDETERLAQELHAHLVEIHYIGLPPGGPPIPPFGEATSVPYPPAEAPNIPPFGEDNPGS